MEQIYNKMLKKAITDLVFLQGKDLLKFKIITSEGMDIGEREVVTAPPKKRKAPSMYPQGEVRNYILNHVKGMAEQDLVSIPFSKYDAECLRGNLCAWATTVWGKGSYTTAVNRKAKTVEILRLPKE